jgi:hypothetical protein
MVEILVPLGFFAMITTIVVGRPIASAYARKVEWSQPMPQQVPGDVSDRLARLEGAVETLTSALERSVEEQRFLTSLLADRQLPAAPPGPQAVPTQARGPVHVGA